MTERTVPQSKRPVVVKISGKLLEDTLALKTLAKELVDLASRESLVLVHGGGEEISANLKKEGILERKVDGLRITDSETLNIVVGTCAGNINARLVSVINVEGVSAVGLTGSDASLVAVKKAALYQSVDGTKWPLGFVGQPYGTKEPKLLHDLLNAGHTPIVASICAGAKGQLYNVNADILASHLAGRLCASRLLVVGCTNGVLGTSGETIPLLDSEAITQLSKDRVVSGGMIIKLQACQNALKSGVEEVFIMNGEKTRRGLFEQLSDSSQIV